MLPVLTGFLFDRIIPLSDFSGLFLVAFAMFVSALAIGLFQVVRSFAMIRVETKIDFQLQNALWDRILNLPVAFFKRFSSGDLASKANSLSVLRKILSSTVIYAIVSGTFGLFNYFVLFVYDPGLALMTTLILLLSMVLLVYTGVKIMKNQRNIIQQQNYISGLLIQFFYSISKLKIAGSEIAAYAMWADKFSKVKKATLKVKRYSNGLQLFMAALPVVATLFLFATISFNKKATLSTGEFMAFFTAFTMTITIILQVGMAGISLFTAIPLFENVKPILETLPENVKFKHEAPVLQGEIELNHVSFRYDPESPLVLKNISLHIGPGEYVAIVGPSGSGKSTLLRLLLGFESPENGAVYYDRQDLANLDPASIRRQIGSVLQETRLAPGNILSNITGTSSATMDDAWNAARKAGLDQDIHQMPMGMFTIVSDGLSTLSGGQRQRVLIARALVANPRILLLDEATSALDNETQRKVAQSLDNIPTTRLIIAHRLSTIKNADRIFVIDNGQLVEEGTYEELMKKNGYFYELVKRQSA
jgi:ATP-binding cassette subfamily C protein